MNLIRSILFALFFYPGTVLAVLAAFPAALIGKDAVWWVTRSWAKYHRWCAAVLLGVRTRIEGERPGGTAIVAVKHQSMFETIEMILVLDDPVVVMKRELSDIPLWGWVARQYGIIPVDRSGGAAALRRMLKAGHAAREQGRPIAIFPEGTRVAPGHQPPLQPGFAGLYKALGLPIVPLALDSGRLWPRRRFVKKPGIVTMRFGTPIPAGLPRPEMEAAVHRAINCLDTDEGAPR